MPSKKSKKKPPCPIALDESYSGVSLQFRSDGNWHVRWRDPISGSPKMRKAGVTAKECQDAATQALREVNGGRSLRNPKARTWDVVDDWFAREVVPNKSYKTQTTYAAYCDAYLSAIADKPIGKISPVTLEIILERLADEGKSSAVRAKVKTIMGSFFAWAKEQKYVIRNPAADLPKIVNIPVRNIADALLEMREMLAVASVTDEYYRVHIKTLAWAGMREGELAGVRRTDLGFHDAGEKPYIKIVQSFDGRGMKSPKNGHPRSVYIPQELADEIERHIAQQDETGIGIHPDGLVFTTPTGAVLHSSNFRVKVFRVAYERAVTAGLIKRRLSTRLDDTNGKPIVPFPHILRHGVASALAGHGVAKEDVASHLGHGSTQVTDGYVHETHEGRLNALSGLEEVIADIRAEDAADAAKRASEIT